MTTYSWGQQSPLEKVELQPFGKKQQAVLYPKDGADPAQLSAIRDLFASQGIVAIPDTHDGQPVLCLRGFESGEYVAAALEQNGFADAGARQTVEPQKTKEKTSVVDTIREKSFKLSGWVYMIGDAALAVSGLKRGDSNETISGLAYGATSVVAAGWGERKQEKVFDDLYSRMLGEFARDGVELPQGTELTAKELGKQNGLVHRINKFLYDYPTQILTAGNVIAGFNLFRAGMNQGSSDKRIAGALVTTGMLIGLLVPEKAPAKKSASLDELGASLPQGAKGADVWVAPQVEEKKGPLGGLFSPLKSAADWVQEKPLRVGGYMAMGNNFFMVKGAMAERTANPLQREYLSKLKQGDMAGAHALSDTLKSKLSAKDQQELGALDPQRDAAAIDARLNKLDKAQGMWKLNMVAAASYLVANGLLSISSTKGGGVDKDGNDQNSELYAAAAAIIANQPQEVQEQSIQKMSVFLASQRELDISPEELAQKMREKVETVKDSPWLHPDIRKQRQGAAAGQNVQPDVQPLVQQDTTPSAQQQNPAAWAEKEAARKVAAKENGLSGAAR